MARTLDDIALFRGAVLALPPVPVARDIPPPRIGFLRTPIWDEAEDDTKALLEKTAAKLSAAGATVFDIAFGKAFDDILDDHGAITGWESRRNYADERLRNPDKVSAELMAILTRSEGITFERYVAAQRKTVAFKEHVDSLFDKVDVLLCPSAPGEAPKGGRVHRRSALQLDLDLGRHAVRDACRQGRRYNMPLGIQLVGLRHEDDNALHRRVGRGAAVK